MYFMGSGIISSHVALIFIIVIAKFLYISLASFLFYNDILDKKYLIKILMFVFTFCM